MSMSFINFLIPTHIRRQVDTKYKLFESFTLQKKHHFIQIPYLITRLYGSKVKRKYPKIYVLRFNNISITYAATNQRLTVCSSGTKYFLYLGK